MEARHHIEQSDEDNGTIAVTPTAGIGQYRDCSTRGTMRPPSGNTTSRLQLHELRDELRRGVMFAQRQEILPASSYESDEMAADGMWAAQEEHDMVELGDRLHHGMRLRSATTLIDDEDDEEIAAFLGLSIPTNQAHSMALHPRASSFSGSRRPGMIPCSPPVPIPQKHWKRRNSLAASTNLRASSSGSMLIPSHDHQYSRTQCEARLWDEYWNYKLSLESRESFEASTTSNQRELDENSTDVKSSSINQAQCPKPRTVSETSTVESSDDCGAEPELDVFAMDDL